jgi:uncharacterized protein (DUF3084 family)
MNYENLTKAKLIEELNKRDAELQINYAGINEKDKIIRSKESAYKTLEERIVGMESDVQRIVTEAVNNVHRQYEQIVKDAQTVHKENENVNRGLLSFNTVIENLLILKEHQNNIVTTVVKELQNQFLIIEKEGD